MHILPVYNVTQEGNMQADESSMQILLGETNPSSQQHIHESAHRVQMFSG